MVLFWQRIPRSPCPRFPFILMIPISLPTSSLNPLALCRGLFLPAVIMGWAAVKGRLRRLSPLFGFEN
ncbi:unnamed protein product [Prunus armeniaca]